MKHRFQQCLLSLTTLCLLASPLWARAWKEVTPGVSKKPEVTAKFGQPTREIARTGEIPKGVVYQGKEAIEGTKQVQFFFGDDEILQFIYVFPKADVKRDQVIKNFGATYEEKMNDSFKTYFYYKLDGLVVYFQEDGQTVSSFTFQKPGT